MTRVTFDGLEVAEERDVDLVALDDALRELAAVDDQLSRIVELRYFGGFSDAVPINFGAERIAQIAAKSGFSATARAHAIDATRRQRHALLPLDPSDWRRLFLRNGAVVSAPLPELHAMHPALRAAQRTKHGAPVRCAYVARDFSAATVRYIEAILGQPGVCMGLISEHSPAGLPLDVRERLAAHVYVNDAHDVHQIADGVRGLSGTLGHPDMLVGVDEDLQVALGEVRELLRITGLKASVARQLTDREMMRDLLRRAGFPVAEGAKRSSECTLEVMTVGRVPAWFSSTRRNGAMIVLPREVEDPSCLDVRQMAYAALRVLGTRTGLSTVVWSRSADGRPRIHDITARPPHVATLSLMNHAHGADMHGAWANVVVNGRFAPIARSHAAGAVFVGREGKGRRVAALRGIDAVKRELGNLIVETRLPGVGARAPSAKSRDQYLIVRHPSTSVVESALAHIASSVAIEVA